MKIESVYDSSFKAYGQILTGYNTAALLTSMAAVPLPEDGVAYEPSIAALEANAVFGQLQNNAYGGMPVEIGMCWGRNTRLNCLEYHRDSELNIGRLDTEKVRAFRAPAGAVVEVYATTLHYAPCHVDAGTGFRVAIVLPKGTNEAKPDIVPAGEEDRRLWARNKWLLAHPESSEAAQGAWVGLTGRNIDLQKEV